LPTAFFSPTVTDVSTASSALISPSIADIPAASCSFCPTSSPFSPDFAYVSPTTKKEYKRSGRRRRRRRKTNQGKYHYDAEMFSPQSRKHFFFLFFLFIIILGFVFFVFLYATPSPTADSSRYAATSALAALENTAFGK
jgi:hypothetical protein